MERQDKDEAPDDARRLKMKIRMMAPGKHGLPFFWAVIGGGVVGVADGKKNYCVRVKV